jgi:hypothetical protein
MLENEALVAELLSVSPAGQRAHSGKLILLRNRNLPGKGHLWIKLPPEQEPGSTGVAAALLRVPGI